MTIPLNGTVVAAEQRTPTTPVTVLSCMAIGRRRLRLKRSEESLGLLNGPIDTQRQLQSSLCRSYCNSKLIC